MKPVPQRTERSSACGECLPRTDRLRARRQFLLVQGTGARVRTRHFIIVLLPSKRQRFGITVTKKVAGSVGRNRVKRLTREAFRRNRKLFPELCDVVLLARSGAHELDYDTVCAELTRASAAMVRAVRAERAPHVRGRGKPRREGPT